MKNACMCCSTKQIQHEDLSLLSYPKIYSTDCTNFDTKHSTIKTTSATFNFLKFLSICFISLRQESLFCCLLQAANLQINYSEA